MKFLILISSLIIISCGRQAELKNVKNAFVEQAQTSNLEPSATSVSSKVRAMTLLSYPVLKDTKSWSFLISDETKESWNIFLNSLTFSKYLITEFPLQMNSISKVQEVVTLIQSSGESRDQAYKKISPLKIKLQKIDQSMVDLKEKLTPKDLDSYVCFFAKKPAAGKDFECMSKADGEFTKTKSANNCRDFTKFKFIDVEINEKIQEAKVACLELKNGLDDLKSQSEIIDNSIAAQTIIRSAGESVVIDLLQSIEKENSGLVLLATGATIEKNKDPSDAVSKLVISKENLIETLSLIIDFGPNLSSGSGKIEYSLENGKITNLSFKKEVDGVWTLKFDIVTSDFTVKTNLSYSVHSALGMRLVGDAYFYYPNGDLRKGVMKLEFDLE